MPKGGGAIRGIGEKFGANPVTGTASFSIPIATSPARSDFQPQFTLAYDSGAGNGPFGLGWTLSVPKITRKTDRGVPRYADEERSDVFILSDAEDLVPSCDAGGRPVRFERQWQGVSYVVDRFRPRVDAAFARIERWTASADDVHWRVTTKDNLVSVYGDSPSARVADPEDASRIFTWLLTRTYDDKGNAIVYDYKSEDGAGVPPALHELHRGAGAARYLKRVRYGPQTPYVPGREPPEWHFELVFDYGEHDLRAPRSEEELPWTVRPDPFSTYRSGFEIRTYRRCRRALMFHRFAELGDDTTLVRSTDFTYAGQDETSFAPSLVASFITSIVQAGYVRDGNGYRRATMPPIELEYSSVEIDQTVRIPDRDSLVNLPEGIGVRDHFVDLDGEGLSGVLTRTAGAWLYKRNRSESAAAAFAPTEIVRSHPSSDPAGRTQFLDLAGDGRIDAVDFDAAAPGFYERTADHSWELFRTFSSLPNLDWNDPNLRFVDLTGDGHADVLLTEEHAFTWYPSLAEEGFGEPVRVPMAADEERGPRLLFADPAQSVYLADMSGDGLTDLVRIRNGDVAYWPSLGYGRFGAKVTMSNAPLFDHPDRFDQKKVRLADVDGSGTTDILYLGRDAVAIYFNRSGNSWSSAVELTRLPPLDTAASVNLLDLLGSGTACLVWSSPLPADAGEPLRYVDLMSGGKPHLLVAMRNNLGSETRVQYAPSTKFYLADKAAGAPWVTRLTFPVHAVEQVEAFDRIGGTKLVTRYAYHHGYFDGPEREFRGFGRVEQWDAESFSGDDELHLPPVRTVTWYHNGAFLDDARISRQYESEYYAGDPSAHQLADTSLPPGVSGIEAREACRALKGKILRQEIYSDDGSPRAAHPYRVTEHAYELRRIQTVAGNGHAVFQVWESESLEIVYERDPADPRIRHTLTLEVDEVGHVTRMATVAYPRRPVPARIPEQSTRLITLDERRVANVTGERDWYRHGLPVETSTYELTGVEPLQGFFRVDEMRTAIAGLTEPPRLIKRERTLYRSEDLSAALPPGDVSSRAIVHQTYELAFTPALLERLYGDRADDSVLAGEGGYVRFDDGSWWMPSARIFFAADVELPAAGELAFAREHFFLPHALADPFGNVSTMRYDAHHILPLEVRDPVGNVRIFENDYRVLEPRLITDANGNRSATAYDALGLPAGTALMGRSGEPHGDSLEGFRADLDPEEVEAFFADPRGPIGKQLLGQATTRVVYDLGRFARSGLPVYAASIARETHVADPLPPGGLRAAISFVYSDGFGREVEKKVQAEGGVAVSRDAAGAIERDAGEAVVAFSDRRWVGSGRTVYDNKGNRVKQYEPFFDSTHRYVEEKELVELGVTPIFRYDPLKRLIRSEVPNGSFTRIAFDAWSETTWDENDTVLESRWLADRESLPATPENAAERRAAAATRLHAATPAQRHYDPLGRTVRTIADNGPAAGGAPQKFETRLVLDIEGNTRAVIDPLGRTAAEYDYDMLARRCRQENMDAGPRWTLTNCAKKAIRRWDARGQQFSVRYDPLHRPTHEFVEWPQQSRALLKRTVYGESRPDGAAFNAREKPWVTIDGSGASFTVAHDFKGNLLERQTRLARQYRELIDWSPLENTSAADLELALAPLLEEESFAERWTYDALGRIVTTTTPDRSVVHTTFNDAGLVERVDVRHRGAASETPFVLNVDYNAKGQRTRVEHGSAGVVTLYDYDPETFRLAELLTTRPSGNGREALQHLRYTYDPVGNILEIGDDAQQTIYFDNRRVEPSARYAYDPLYRLIEATGREHLGQQAPVPYGDTDVPHVPLPHPGDGNAMGTYRERYAYDAVGNLLELAHQGTDPQHPGWRRSYVYETSNRLVRTVVDGDDEPYSYDAHGNLSSMPHLPRMEWNAEDRLAMTARQAVSDDRPPRTTWYVYDSTGRRVRKITQNGAGVREAEVLYLGGLEIDRAWSGGVLQLERQTLHVMDDKRLVALVEQLSGSPQPLIRYQFPNHLGSASLELDERAAIVSYEEYYPYGSTSYQAGRSKRYRYTGKERDEESGLYYHAARYYAPWLGRWTACDPAELSDGVNVYAYARGNPVRLVDPEGTQSTPAPAPGASPSPPLPPKGRPDYKGGVGDIAHRDILPVLAGRLREAGYEAYVEEKTLHGGSRSGISQGEIDLVVAMTMQGVKTGHVYDLKPMGSVGNSKYDKQINRYVHHGSKLVQKGRPLAYTTGTVLEQAAQEVPDLFEPISVDKVTYTRWYYPYLPNGPDGTPAPGYIEYVYVDEEKEPELEPHDIPLPAGGTEEKKAEEKKKDETKQAVEDPLGGFSPGEAIVVGMAVSMVASYVAASVVATPVPADDAVAIPAAAAHMWGVQIAAAGFAAAFAF